MKYLDAKSYLNFFWPQKPLNDSIFNDNIFLIDSYIKFVNYLDKNKSKKYKWIDISTGPVLVPLLCVSNKVKYIQFSDYCESGRTVFYKTPFSCWSEYIKLINSRLATPVNVKHLKSLIKKASFIDVDLMKKEIFDKDVDSMMFDIFMMHLVADSITKSKKKYYGILKKIIDKMPNGSILFMSVLVNCSYWEYGKAKYPSPNVSSVDVDTVLNRNNLRIIFRSSQTSENKDHGHDGSMYVVAAVKNE